MPLLAVWTAGAFVLLQTGYDRALIRFASQGSNGSASRDGASVNGQLAWSQMRSGLVRILKSQDQQRQPRLFVDPPLVIYESTISVEADALLVGL